MRRAIVLGTLLVFGTLSMAIQAVQQLPAAPSADALQVDKVRDTLYVLRGGGGNTAVLVMANGVLLVDTKLSGWGQPLVTKIKTLTDKPITTIINTHTHFDHVNGNVELPGKLEIVTHANTKRYMDEANPVLGIQTGPQTNIFKAAGGKGMPTRTFTDKLTLGRGADQVDLYYHGRAHTGGDAWVVFPSLRVMHGGDAFAGKNLPIMDANNGGSGVAYPDTIAAAAANARTINVETVITGHAATTMTVADLEEFSRFMREFVRTVQEGKKAGRTADAIAAAWKTPDQFRGYGMTPPERVRTYVQVVFDETK
jgi:glyoxylase-like metal-dependent hydrolase (beta-lactamase superfamily II)